MDRPDPGWKLYLRFAAWTFPGGVLLFFSNVFLIPRLEYLYDQIDQERIDGSPIEFLIQSTHFFCDYFQFLLAGFALLVALVEYFFRTRPKLRIAFYEVTSWVFNLAVLAHLTTVTICSQILAPLVNIQPP